MLTQEELKSFAHYDPETGKFTRLVAPCNSVKVGDELGYSHRAGGGLMYRKVEHGGKCYQLHRLAFLYMTGSFPGGHVDHIDGDGMNNRWANLRSVSMSENQRNRRLHTNNRSGFPGVSFFKRTGKWRAAINIKRGVKTHIGYFDTLEEAIAARAKAQEAAGYHENHGERRRTA